MPFFPAADRQIYVEQFLCLLKGWKLRHCELIPLQTRIGKIFLLEGV